MPRRDSRDHGTGEVATIRVLPVRKDPSVSVPVHSPAGDGFLQWIDGCEGSERPFAARRTNDRYADGADIRRSAASGPERTFVLNATKVRFEGELDI